jgi:hypothetical protein
VASGHFEGGTGFSGESQTGMRESKPPERFCSYITMVSSIRESEPSTSEEATGRQVWRDAMMEEYNSVMKNDILEIVPRPEGKSIQYGFEGSYNH